MQLDFNTISAIGFYTSLAILFIIFRKKIKIIQGVVIGFTTTKFNKWLKKVGSHKKLWKWTGNIAIITSLLGMIFISFLLAKIAYVNVVSHRVKSLSLVIPGIHIPGSPIFIPFWYGIISIFIIVIVHEFSHAIMAYAEKIKVNSVGFGLLLIFPVAFVQPDEKKFEKAKGIARARVAAMGPFANVVLTFVAFGVLIAISHFGYSHFFVAAYPLNSSINISNGTQVYSVNGIPVHTPNDVIRAIGNSKTVNLVTSSGNVSYNITSKPHVMFQLSTDSQPILITYKFFNWLANLSLAIALVNLLPVVFLDGSLMLDGLLEKKIKSREIRSKIILTLSAIFGSILVFDLVMSYI